MFMAEINFIVDVISIILAAITIIIVVLLNIWNMRKADKRLEKLLKKEENVRKGRIQKIFNVLKKLINDIIIIGDPSERGNYMDYWISFKENIDSPSKMDLDQRRITETRAFLKSLSEDLKYFGIQPDIPLSLLQGRYIIKHTKLEILKPYDAEKKDIKNKIISEMKQHCKEYFDIDLN